MVKEPKVTKSFFWALFVNISHNYKIIIISCLSITCFNIWLEDYFGIWKKIIFYILLKWPFKKLTTPILEIHNQIIYKLS
jgi:hypothetical protein